MHAFFFKHRTVKKAGFHLSLDRRDTHAPAYVCVGRIFTIAKTASSIDAVYADRHVQWPVDVHVQWPVDVHVQK